jgi:hypothetical protein
LLGRGLINAQPWPDGRIVSEFVAHDSKLQFGSLNHGPAADLNPAGVLVAASAAVEGLLIEGNPENICSL